LTGVGGRTNGAGEGGGVPSSSSHDGQSSQDASLLLHLKSNGRHSVVPSPDDSCFSVLPSGEDCLHSVLSTDDRLTFDISA